MAILFENIAERFRMNGITEDQLAQYVKLKVITQTQADELLLERQNLLASEGGK